MFGIWGWISSAVAGEILIQPSGTNDALFSAIHKASSGDTIVLSAGNYQECVDTLGKDLIFQGQEGAKIVGNGSCATLLSVKAGEVWFKNLTLSHQSTCMTVSGRSSTAHLEQTNLLQCGNSRLNGGGAIVTEGRLSLINSKISGNQGQKGGGIYVKNGVVELKNMVISDNNAQIGGAIFAQESEVRIEDSRLLGNETKSGGMGAGVAMRNGGYLTIVNSVLQGNHAQGKGGAIYVDTSSSTAHNHLELTKIQCHGNSASFGSSTGGCLYVRGHTSVAIEDSSLHSNLAALSGGAIAVHDAQENVVIRNSSFQKNRARSGEGGAILVESSSEKLISTVQIVNSTFDDNRAETYGGALALGNTVNPYANLEVESSKFTGNLANSSQSGAGGAIYYVSQAPQTMRIVKSTFSQNKAELVGGAIYAINPQTVWLEDSQFYNNSAEGASTIQPRFGGAVMLDGATVTFVERSKFCGNVSQSLGGKRISGTGGGLYVQQAERLVLEQSWFWENNAQEQGGALSTDLVKNIELAEVILAGNRAQSGGAVFFNASKSLAKDVQVAYTQAGIATKVNGEGSIHQWRASNWFNNVDGDGSLGVGDTPITLTDHTAEYPNFKRLVVDGRCDDDLTMTGN